MELATTLIALVSFLALVVFMFVKSGNSTHSHIPGPKKLPLIGNLHLLLSTSTPHHLFRDLAAEYGPLMHLQLGQVPFLIVSSVDIEKHVMKTHDIIFANRPPGFVPEVLTYHYTDVGYAPYGEYWRQLRKICTLELLSVKRVHSFKMLPLITGLRFKVNRIYWKTRAAFDSIIEEHRVAIAEKTAAADGLDDLADVLLKHQHEGDQLPLSNGNITAVIMDMFIAGSETSAGVVDWTMSELIKNRNILKKVQKEVREVFDNEGCIDEDKLHKPTFL